MCLVKVMKKRIVSLCSLLLVFASILSGCNKTSQRKNINRYSKTVYEVYNTTVTLYMYDEKKLDKIFPSFSKLALDLHKEMDRDHDYEGINNLKTINDSYGSGQAIAVSPNLIEVLSISMKMAELTKGYFNPAMGTIIDLWEPKLDPKYNEELGEYNYDNTDETDENINNALKCVPTLSELQEILIIDKENNTVTLNSLSRCDKSVKISLGGIGKGYAMDKLKELYVSKYGNEPALIDGGTSSIHMIGISPFLRTKGDVTDNYWVIKPIAPRYLQYTEGLFLYARKGDVTISTSGNSVKYFELVDNNGDPVYDEYGLRVIRTHILNPFTGKSEQYYDSINVASDADAGVLDALTTALYNVNDLNVVKEIIEDVEEYYGIGIDYSFAKLIKNTATGREEIIVHMGQSMKDKTYEYNDRIVENDIF